VTVEVGGETYFYEQRGAGRDVLLMPGLGASVAVWWPQLRDLSPLARVTAVDPRGHGGSSRPPGPYSIAGLADDTAGVVGALGLAPAVLVASSMASLTAVHLAATQPDLVGGLVLVGGFPKLTPAAAERFEGRARQAETEGMAPVAELVIQAALGPYTHQTNPGLVGLFRAVLQQNDPTAYAASCRAIVAADTTAHLPAVRCPTLVLLGEQELVAPLPQARALYHGIPDSRLVVIPRAGHLPFLEQPEAFNAAVQRFLAELP
jgi:3-oxoadipate enol-lactonase